MSLAASHTRFRASRGRHRATARRNSLRSTGLVAALILVTAIVIVSIGGLVWGLIWFGGFAGALPPPDQLTAHRSFQTTQVYGSDHATLLYEITDPEGGRRTIVPLDAIPRNLIEATIATEDAGFFSNPGFELRSIVRALTANLARGQIISGASTITQQVVRNVLLTPAERNDLSPRRKIREVILAYQLTQTYSKEEILQIYLNEIPYGNRSHGVEAAAEGYFGKEAGNLDLAECALLAGIPQAPSFYDPYARLSDVKDRQSYVLQRMVEQGYITDSEAADAAAEELHFVDPLHAVLAPHFVALVTAQLEKQLGTDQLYHNGNDAVTTLDVGVQRSVQDAITANATGLKQTNANNVAVVALDPRDGHILAMVGSASYDDSSIAGEVNMALAPRQSGGILSPVTYALALKSGQTLNGVITIPTPGTTNANLTPNGASTVRQARNTVTLREALARGLEQPASDMMRLVGNQSFVDTMIKAGIPDIQKRIAFSGDGSIAGAQVSPLEVAQVYATMAVHGVAHPPIALDRVVDPSDRIVWQAASEEHAALDPGSAFLVGKVLADPSLSPFPQGVIPSDAVVAGHLATSDDHRDSWAAGYDANFVLVVWIGNASGQELKDSDVAARIWGEAFRDILQTRPSVPFDQPADVVELNLCRNAGCTLKRTEYVLHGTEAVALAANLATIAQPTTPILTSRTPLLNRDPQGAPGVVLAPLPPAPAKPTVGGLVTVPDVSRTSPDQARQRLAIVGLTNASKVQYILGKNLSAKAKAVAPGQVVETIPPFGVGVQPGTSIVLVVRPN